VTAAGPPQPRSPEPPVARAVDALLEASVIGSFSRLGLAARSRLLPEFTADDRPPFTGRVAIVTGATSGIGRAVATELARRGGIVHFLARDAGRAERAQRQIAAAAGGGQVTYGLGDLDDLDSVRAFARDFRATHGHLDVLIHGAGAINKDYRANEAGIELTVASQVIAPFLLTRLLLPPLRAAGRRPGDPARVIFVSSGGMYSQRLDPATLQMQASGYKGATAYARAKRAQVALSREWARRLAGTGVTFHAMHPGWADTPGLAVALPGFHRVMGPILRSPQQGADTVVWLATADAGRLGSGQFWHDRRPRPEYLLPWTRESSPAIAGQLWECIAGPSGLNDPESQASSPPATE
jgi:dehydrogenase/reductase SDR family member 12